MKQDKVNIINEIQMAFNRLIGPIAIMSKLDSYKKDRKELTDLLDIISNWAAQFQLHPNLSFISREELLNVYSRLDEIKDKYLYDKLIGDVGEISDKAVIWMWEIMTLRKKQIEGEK